MNALEKLRTMTKIVSDSGDFETAKKYHPQDATTNPSLLMAASQMPIYEALLKNALTFAAKRQTLGIDKATQGEQLSSLALDKLVVNFGCEYLKLIPGRISTEVDARLSYDTAGTIAKARQLIELYRDAGVPKERVLIKIAGTWEGIQAARQLELEGIHCNITLIFSLVQAAAAAEAGATLISPFVGRILDWHRHRKGQEYTAEEDPGVKSVQKIYYYLKKFSLETIVMGASFRNVDEILALAGIDFVTISPKLLEELTGLDSNRITKPALRPEDAYSQSQEAELFHYLKDESLFRQQLEADEMASGLLTDGIKRFDEDARRLQNILRDRLIEML